MRCFFVFAGKEPMKMKPRHERLLRHRVEINRHMEILIDENFCPGNTLVCVCGDLQSGIKVRICFLFKNHPVLY